MALNRISEDVRLSLLNDNPNTSKLVSLQEPDETGLVMRVDDLILFHNPFLQVMVRARPWYSSRGIWAVAIAFGIYYPPRDKWENVGYLDPRHILNQTAGDWYTA